MSDCGYPHGGTFTDEDRWKWVYDYIVAYHHEHPTIVKDIMERQEKRDYLKAEPLNVLGKFVRSYAIIARDLLNGTLHACTDQCDTIE